MISGKIAVARWCPLALLLCGCLRNPMADISLPQLCPRASGDVPGMAKRIHGQPRRLVLAHFGKPAQQGPDDYTGGEKLVWGPLTIEYRRVNGRIEPMHCTVEMHVGDGGTISRVVWSLTIPPAETPERPVQAISPDIPGFQITPGIKRLVRARYCSYSGKA
jgi:hypothetical protein